MVQASRFMVQGLKEIIDTAVWRTESTNEVG